MGKLTISPYLSFGDYLRGDLYYPKKADEERPRGRLPVVSPATPKRAGVTAFDGGARRLHGLSRHRRAGVPRFSPGAAREGAELEQLSRPARECRSRALPARSAVEIGVLMKNEWLVEIDAFAIKD